MTAGPKEPVSVGLISLGCAKNLVDAEIMLGSLIKSGFRITNEAASADVVIVNTCSFIDAAQEESIDAILESAQARQRNHPRQGLIVSGCMPQQFREDLPKLLPEVDAFMGIDQVAHVAEIVEQAMTRRREKLADGRETAPLRKDAANRVTRLNQDQAQVHVHHRPSYVPDYATPRFRLTPSHFAYVKIAEGCNHPCSFCSIPRMRGAHRSRPQADIVLEARRLIAEGVKELNLISQDSTYYGLDLRTDRSHGIASPEKFAAAARALPVASATLATLLRELNELPGDFWIRLLYTHPAHWTDELISTIADCPKVARYIDMPLQHIHPNMLERMRRETSREYIVDLIAKLRAGIPGLALRTTFIVGFPGETEEHFEALLEFMRSTRFERLGVFTYSQQEGTRAARMEAQVTGAVKKRRQLRAMTEQLSIARELSASRVGSEIMVLVEREAAAQDLEAAQVRSWEHGLIRAVSSGPTLHAGRRRYWVSRSEADAPDIDGRVYVRG
ncbi:MAG TPA: 30S ribosomal protein S12 methylthiotransferase RimO, partial [Candidatus Acidoferrales bacterium]|nr:30S ribosomal protein S12 methylthiotransferase RimO [Candidatus Acidoferrales bacterium]